MKDLEDKYAIVDLGSNSVRMIIMQVNSDNSYKMVEQAKEMVRLSEGMGQDKILSEAAIKRTIDALRLFKRLMGVHSIKEAFLVATAAVRNATNQESFLDRVRLEAGLDFTVISGEKEAYYAYLGVINTISISNCIIIDVGGASTEIIWVEGRKLKEAVSLSLGAVTLSEALLEEEGTASNKIRRLEKDIKDQLRGIDWLNKVVGLPIVGLGGTIRTLAKVDKKKCGLSTTNLHNYHLKLSQVMHIYDRVTKVNPKRIRKILGITRERADIIVGGLVPIKCLTELLKANEIIVSGNGLREGVFYDKHFERLKKERVVDDVLAYSINNALKLYEANIEHSKHVTKLALSIFNQTKEIHGLDNSHRDLLETASMLHDIGNYVDYYNHHKHGFYLVLNSRIYGLKNKALLMCAYLVAMHREADFKESWKAYRRLINRDDYDIIKKLSIFLKIAEKLDRSEYGIVKDVVCDIYKEHISIRLIADGGCNLEKAATMHYSKKFKKIFNRELKLV